MDDFETPCRLKSFLKNWDIKETKYPHVSAENCMSKQGHKAQVTMLYQQQSLIMRAVI